MPNFDGGHYFLTVLAPISAKLRVDERGRRRSPAHLIREELAFLPNAERTVASAGGRGDDNPFARVPRTHFARFFVLDDVVYNGRLPSDVLLDTVKSAAKARSPLTTAQPVDRLPTKYLVFAATFDAASGARSERDSYLTALWDEMGGPLTRLLGNCDGFDGVATAAQFCAYIEKCQVETTLPFNDYWIADPPPLKGIPPMAFVPAIGVAAAGLLAAAVLPMLEFRWPIGAAVFVVSAIVAAGLAGLALMQAGAAPFPTAPNSDLPSILKALHLQRVFTAFAIEVQGVDADTLHDKFGKFLADHRPDDVNSKTQRPGIIPRIDRP
jgi:hypothetical protein